MWRFFTRKNKFKEWSDEALVSSYKEEGDKEIIGILYDRYAQHLFGFCMKYLREEDKAKDVVAGIFVRLFDDLGRFDIKNFKGWITRVAFNDCMNGLAAEKKKELLEEAYLYEINNETVDNIAPDSEEVIAAMETLKEEQKICLEYFYLKKMSYSHISEKTGYSMNQVKSYIQNGKRNLELYFRKHHERIS